MIKFLTALLSLLHRIWTEWDATNFGSRAVRKPQRKQPMKSNGNSIWRSTLLGLTILCVTSACATVSTTPPAVSPYCAVAHPIRYDSRIDRPETVRQIEAHNSVWACLCEQDCPATAPDTR